MRKKANPRNANKTKSGHDKKNDKSKQNNLKGKKKQYDDYLLQEQWNNMSKEEKKLS